MATSIATYRPSSLVIAISHPAKNVSHVIGNMAKDSVVSIEYPDARWTNKSTNEGNLIRVHNADNNIRMTVHLDQTSASNDVLEAFANFDEKDPTGLDGIFTCSFADKSSRAWAYSAECFVQRPQNYEYNSDTSTRDWIITFSKPDQFMGGSGKLDSEIVSLLSAFGIDVEDRWKATY